MTPPRIRGLIDKLERAVESKMHAKHEDRAALTAPPSPDAELVACLKFARTTMAVVADTANLRGVEYRSLVTEVKRIDAALSAVCAAAPNIATTSEHSGS